MKTRDHKQRQTMTSRERERDGGENSFVPLRVNRQTLTSNDEQWKAVMANEKLTFKKQPVCLPLCRLTNPIPGLHPAAQHNPESGFPIHYLGWLQL